MYNAGRQWNARRVWVIEGSERSSRENLRNVRSWSLKNKESKFGRAKSKNIKRKASENGYRIEDSTEY